MQKKDLPYKIIYLHHLNKVYGHKWGDCVGIQYTGHLKLEHLFILERSLNTVDMGQ